MKDKILAALKSIDTKVDSTWTQDGLVNLSAFKFLVGGTAVTREQLEEVAPGFNRTNATSYFTEVPATADEVPPATDKVVVVTSPVTAATTDTVRETILALVGLSEHIDVSTLTFEELGTLFEEMKSVRSRLYALRQEINSIVEDELLYAGSVDAAYHKVKPKENLADMVKQQYYKNTGKVHEIDRVRHRPAAAHPPLKRR